MNRFDILNLEILQVLESFSANCRNLCFFIPSNFEADRYETSDFA